MPTQSSSERTARIFTAPRLKPVSSQNEGSLPSGTYNLSGEDCRNKERHLH